MSKKPAVARLNHYNQTKAGIWVAHREKSRKVNPRNSLENTMSIIRLILGKLTFFFNWAFPLTGIKRDSQVQSKIDLQTARLKLYQYRACPFCVKVRQPMGRQSLTIEKWDVKRSDSARDKLAGGWREFEGTPSASRGWPGGG